MNFGVTWYEIPVSDMTRAVAFYSSLFEMKIEISDFGELKMAIMPYYENQIGISGALVENKAFYHADNQKGPLLYFETDSVAKTLEKAVKLGGSIIIEEKMISPEHGSMGVFLDTEGNRIALHAKPKA
ncbi:MAG: VOC family protein [Saprospiraceae bacterium]|nr:VOC family protein [Saprospiraceae bacterium]